MNAACVAFIHPSLNLHNLIKDHFSTVPSFHRCLHLTRSRKGNERRHVKGLLPALLRKMEGVSPACFVGRGTAGCFCNLGQQDAAQENCCPPPRPRETARPLQTPQGACLGKFRLQLQADNTSVLFPWMIQGTRALNTGLNRTPTI